MQHAFAARSPMITLRSNENLAHCAVSHPIAIALVKLAADPAERPITILLLAVLLPRLVCALDDPCAAPAPITIALSAATLQPAQAPINILFS